MEEEARGDEGVGPRGGARGCEAHGARGGAFGLGGGEGDPSADGGGAV